MADLPAPLLRIDALRCHFGQKAPGFFGGQGASLKALDGVSLVLARGETIGIVGESGSGKSTLARTIMGLEAPTAGSMSFRGEDIRTMPPQRRRRLKREIQMVFQDPYASLDPRMKVLDTIAEGWRIHPEIAPPDERRSAAALMEQVGLSSDWLDRYPGQLSGGQRQRIGIARALAVDPEILILDEAVSALDVSIQAQVVNLLEQIQRARAIAYLFIGHDLSIVRHISDRIVVMYMGVIVEQGPAEAVYREPRHPYTKALLSAVPSLATDAGRSERIILRGEIPSPSHVPTGCRFRTRCWKADEVCARLEPALDDRPSPGRAAACHHPELQSVAG